MEFGMPFLLETSTLECCAELCAALGLSFVEWNMSFPQCQLGVLNAERLTKIQSETGIYFTIHLEESLNVCDFNAQVRSAYVNTVLETICLAKVVHIPVLNMHLPRGCFVTLPEGREFLFFKYQELYLEYLRSFRQLCQQAIGDSPIKITIENTDGFLPHEQQAIELLFESPCFGLNLDIGHSHTANNQDLPFYQAHQDKLFHMHAHDALGDQDHLPFGRGDLDLRQRLSIAERVGARVVLEVKTIRALRATVALLPQYLS